MRTYFKIASLLNAAFAIGFLCFGNFALAGMHASVAVVAWR